MPMPWPNRSVLCPVAMIGIAITQAAFDAIASTIPLLSFEAQANEGGERLLWLPPDMLAKLKAMRGPDKSYSGAILASAGGGARGGGECLTRLCAPRQR